MKKVLILCLSLLYGGYTGYAQCTAPSITTTGFHEDYSTATEYVADGRGIYHFITENNTSRLQRDAVAGMLKVEVDQGQGQFEPFGIIFGEDVLLNIESNKSIELSVENYGDEDVVIKVSLVDINGKVLNSQAGGYSIEYAWQYALSTPIYSGGTYDIKHDLHGGRCVDYHNNVITDDFDFSKVKEVHFTVVNLRNTGGGRL